VARSRGPGGRRFDFHSHTYLTDGNESATSMWLAASRLDHRLLAITDHIALEDPGRILTQLRAESEAFAGGPMATLVGVELTLLPPRRIAETARRARTAGAEIVIVHGETTAEYVPVGTNRAAIDSGEVDVLAHPGFLTEREAELAAANGVALEISGRSLHSRTNGHVARLALAAGADVVVDSDAHSPSQLLDYETAAMLARGAGLTPGQCRGALERAPLRVLRRCRGR